MYFILFYFFSRSPSAVSPFSKSLLRDQGRSTEITQPQTALRKELPELQHSLPSSLLPKVCVSLGSSAVFSLVVWGFLLAAFSRQHLLLPLSLLLSLRQWEGTEWIRISPPTPEEGMSPPRDVRDPLLPALGTALLRFAASRERRGRSARGHRDRDTARGTTS